MHGSPNCFGHEEKLFLQSSRPFLPSDFFWVPWLGLGKHNLPWSSRPKYHCSIDVSICQHTVVMIVCLQMAQRSQLLHSCLRGFGASDVSWRLISWFQYKVMKAGCGHETPIFPGWIWPGNLKWYCISFQQATEVLGLCGVRNQPNFTNARSLELVDTKAIFPMLRFVVRFRFSRSECFRAFDNWLPVRCAIRVLLCKVFRNGKIAYRIPPTSTPA